MTRRKGPAGGPVESRASASRADVVSGDEPLLRARAAALATPPASREEEEGDEMALLRVEGARIAVPLAHLAGVIHLEATTPVPGAPRWLAGLTPVRGRPVSVVDLGAVLGVAPGARPIAALVARPRGLVAFAISEIEDLRRFGRSAFEAAPATLSRTTSGFVRGMTTEGVVLLDAEALCASLEERENE